MPAPLIGRSRQWHFLPPPPTAAHCLHRHGSPPLSKCLWPTPSRHPPAPPGRPATDAQCDRPPRMACCWPATHLVQQPFSPPQPPPAFAPTFVPPPSGGLPTVLGRSPCSPCRDRSTSRRPPAADRATDTAGRDVASHSFSSGFASPPCNYYMNGWCECIRRSLRAGQDDSIPPSDR